MSRFQNILIAADFSGPSREAFRLACSLADEHATRLHVLHAMEHLHIAEQAVGFGERGEIVILEEGSPAHHEAVREHLCETYVPARSLNVEYEVRDGDPRETVLQAAEQYRCDLIVMGTHGRTGVRRLLAGSVAEAVLRHAHCPVLALRTGEPTLRPEPAGVILHPVELEGPSDVALHTARALACELGARLVLLYVAPLDLMLNNRSAVVVDIEEYERALESVRAALDGPDLKYPVEARMGRGNVPSEILRAASETHCQLIVMGAHGRHGLGRLLLGSATEAVLRGASCPVLAVKEPAAIAARG